VPAFENTTMADWLSPTARRALDCALVNWLTKACPVFGQRLEQVSRDRPATL
jgi:hypothetical protein